MNLTCQTCQHWAKKVADPTTLGAGPTGECRESPPTAQAVVMPNGQVTILTFYPSPSAEFSACGRHASKVS